AEGTPAEVLANPNSLTGEYLSGKKQIIYNKKRTAPDPARWLKLSHATGNNLP
ncbi:MAG: hypothetical protein RL667_1230, partial [Pseudomonadota bacterium]